MDQLRANEANATPAYGIKQMSISRIRNTRVKTAPLPLSGFLFHGSVGESAVIFQRNVLLGYQQKYD